MFKRILVVLLVLGVLLPLTSSAQTADPLRQSSSEASEIARMIADLQRQIAELKVKLAQLQGRSSIEWCHTFERNLGVGAGGKEVDALHAVLVKEGISISPMPVPVNTTLSEMEKDREKSKATFTEATAAAVSAFQLKYKDEILTPLGLSNPTGYVGPSTRKVLNRLYGCQFVIKPPQPPPGFETTINFSPTIFSVSGPTALKIGEQGTWSVQASDPENGPLSYSVVWGDEATTGSTAGSPMSSIMVQQTATFTHSYVQAGTYYPKFKVTDNAGQSNSTSLSVAVGNGGINPPNQLLTVISPNGGEAWQKGTIQRIGWSWQTNAFVGQQFEIYLTPVNWSPSNPQLVIATGVAGTSYYDWAVGKARNLVTGDGTAPSQSYYVAICAPSNFGGRVCDQSDSYFKIYDSDQTGNQPPKIVTPSGNPIVSVGETVNIALIASDPDGDRLSMSVDWGDNTGSASSCPTYPLSHTDQLFSNQELRASHVYSAAKTYSVTARIIDCRGGEAKQSLEVEVHQRASSVQVLSPNGGETWFKGQTYTVSWGATGAPEVSVYLVRDSDPTYRLAIRHNFVSGRANSITWTVPGGQTATSDIAAGSDYRIWVIGGGTTAVDDKSDQPFKIVAQ